MKAKARARHDCVNRRFKESGILQQRFRSDVHMHGIAFCAVANIVHLQMNGQGLWHVTDNNDKLRQFGKTFYKDQWEHCHDALMDWYAVPEDYADY